MNCTALSRVIPVGGKQQVDMIRHYDKLVEQELLFLPIAANSVGE
jgi:hypothetical protein